MKTLILTFLACCFQLTATQSWDPATNQIWDPDNLLTSTQQQELNSFLRIYENTLSAKRTTPVKGYVVIFKDLSEQSLGKYFKILQNEPSPGSKEYYPLGHIIDRIAAEYKLGEYDPRKKSLLFAVTAMHRSTPAKRWALSVPAEIEKKITRKSSHLSLEELEFILRGPENMQDKLVKAVEGALIPLFDDLIPQEY